MVYKIKTPIRKIGGSYYCLIPSGIVQELDLSFDNDVLAEFEKYRDIIKELCERYSASGKKILLSCTDKQEMEGNIIFVNKNSIDFMNNDKIFVIPFNFIKEIKEDKNGK